MGLGERGGRWGWGWIGGNVVGAAVLIGLGWAGEAVAGEGAGPALSTSSTDGAGAAKEAAPAAVITPVRVALSKAAADFLTEGRVRQLIDLELPASTPLAGEPVGPLDENAVRVYIDLPRPGAVVIQVQGPQRRLETRTVNVTGLAWDVAARVTAIATSESVRAQVAPLPKRSTKPRPPTPEEIENALRRSPAIGVGASFAGAYLPRLRGGLVGSRVGLELHQPVFSEHLSLAAMGGSGETGQLRWIELAVGATHRMWLGTGVHLEVGAEFALAQSRMAPLASVAKDAVLNAEARAAAVVGLGVRLHREAWLTLDLDPGAVVTDTPSGIQGAWLGVALGIAFEKPLNPIP